MIDKVRILESEKLIIKIADEGAELSSVYDKETQEERIWDANPQVWNRHAPILFPFVGKVINGVYRIGNTEYEMKTQHGFARDMTFVCIEETDKSITHQLLATEDTKKKYPFDFELLVTHKMSDENPRLLEVIWKVVNHGQDTMYFSIGGHPAFTVPVEKSEDRKEYYIEFPGREELTYIGVNPENGFAAPDKAHNLKLENGFVQFFEDIYDTLIFDYQNIDAVRIAKPDKTPYVTMNCSEFPMLAIWAKRTGNFICLEPWIGRTDDDGFCGTIDEKIGVVALKQNEDKIIRQTIEFHK